MNEILKADRVDKIFKECLFSDEEIESGAKDHCVTAEGIKFSVGFHPARLDSFREEIITMLYELPEQFQSKGGGGWSFLNACDDKNGEQWTGIHERMDQLFMLGIAIKRVKWLMPREMWSVFPGGMPYVVVHEKDIEEIAHIEAATQ